MNKRIFISISIVLAVGIIVTGVLYTQETSKLKDAQSEIAALEGDVSALEGNVSALEADLVAAEGQVSTLEIDLAAALGSLKVDISAEPMLGGGFFPAIITVPVGTTVTWTNLTWWVHIVSSSQLFDSGRLSPGDSFSYTFTQQGVFYYYCGEEDCSPFHDDLYGTVIVE